MRSPNQLHQTAVLAVAGALRNAAVAALLLTAALSAQQTGTKATADPTPVESLGKQFVREDGSVDVPGQGQTRSWAVTSWLLLQMESDGSTLRVGDDRGFVRMSTKWLQEQNAASSTPPDTEPAAVDRAVVALAMAETFVLSESYRPIKAMVLDSTKALTAALTADDASPASPELVALALLLHRTLRQAKPPVDDEPLAKALVEVKVRPPSSPAELAAEVLLNRLLGKPLPKDAELAHRWPKDLAAEPLATLYLTLATYTADAKVWDVKKQRLAPLLPAIEAERKATTWEPHSEADRQLGRAGVAALHALTKSLYERSAKLACVRDM